jgi:molecular chaperone GrpE
MSRQEEEHKQTASGDGQPRAEPTRSGAEEAWPTADQGVGEEAQAAAEEMPSAAEQAPPEQLEPHREPVTLPYGEYEELKTLARERDDFLRHLQRAVADYQNLQKRIEGLRESAREAALRSVAEEIVPVTDGLKRAMEAAEQVQGAESIVQGLRLVERGFYGALGRFGIRPLEAVGRKFDPHYHEAAMREYVDGVAPNTVIRELRTGFVMGDTVIRPSQVVVAATRSVAPQEAEGDEKAGGMAEEEADGGSATC